MSGSPFRVIDGVVCEAREEQEILHIVRLSFYDGTFRMLQYYRKSPQRDSEDSSGGVIVDGEA